MTSASTHCTRADFSSALPVVALSGKSLQTWESSYEHGEVPVMLLCTRERHHSFSTFIDGNKSSACAEKLVSAFLFYRDVPGVAGAWTFLCGGFLVVLLFFFILWVLVFKAFAQLVLEA